MRNRLDEIFKSKLKDSEASYSHELWANIENELFPEKSNRYAGLWLLFLGALFLMPIYLLKDINSKSSFPTENIKGTSEQTVMHEAASDIENKNSLIVKQPINQDDFDKKESLINPDNSISTNNKTEFVVNNKKNNSEEKIVTQELNKAPLTNNELVSNDLDRNIKANPVSNVFRIINTSKNQKNKNILGTESNVSYSERIHSSSSTLPKLNIGLDYISKPYSIDTDNCEEKTSHLNKWYSEIYAGLGFAPKTYNAKSIGFEDYVNIREASESAAISYNGGFSVGYQFTSGFLLEGGFEYAQYNYGIEYKEHVMTTTNITIDTIISPNMDTIVHRDTTIVETFDLRNKSLKHQNIEIPLLVGMEFNLDKKLSLAVKTGIALNIYSQSSGFMLDPDGVAINIANDGLASENNYYKSSFGISFPFNASLYYKMTPEIDLFTRAGVKYYTGSITQDNFEIKEKLVYNNLSFGIRIQI